MSLLRRAGSWCDVGPIHWAYLNIRSLTVETLGGTFQWGRMLTEPLLYLRMAEDPGGHVCVVGQSQNGQGLALLVDRVVPLGLTFGGFPVVLRWDPAETRFEYAVQRSASLYARGWIDGPTPTLATMPATSQGFRDLTPDGTLIRSDDAFVAVQGGWTFHQPMTRGPATVGQTRTGISLSLTGPPHVWTAIPGDQCFEPHVAALGTHLAVCARTSLGATLAQFDPPYPPDERPTGVPVPPQPPGLPAKATIDSFETPIRLDQLSRAVARVTQGTPEQFRWQWQEGGTWHVAALNPATDYDHSFNRPNPPWTNVFTTVGRYPIRLQTLVNGVIVDQTGTLRVIEVQAAPTPIPPEPPIPPTPIPPGAIHGPLRLDLEGRFVDDVGLYSVRGISEFDLLHLARTGRRAEVETRLDFDVAHGRNTVRVFGSKSIQNTMFDLDPDQLGYDDAFAWLIGACATRGIRILFVVFCDTQILYPQHVERVRVLTHLLDRFGVQSPILWALANEAAFNGWSEADDPKLLELADLTASKLGHRTFLVSDPHDGDAPDVSAAAVEKQKTIARHANLICLHPSRKGGSSPTDGHYRRWVNHLESSVDMITAVRQSVGNHQRQIVLDEPMGHASACTGSRECDADAALAGAMVAACTGQPYVYHRIFAQDPATPGLDLIAQFVPLVPVDGQYLNDSWAGSPSHGFTKWDKVRWRVLGSEGWGIANGIEKGTITYANGWHLQTILYDGPHCQVLKVVK